MRIRGGSAVIGVLLVIGAAGCGGSGNGGGGSDVYTLEATQACFDKGGLQTTVVENRFLPGSGGNLRVRLTNRKPLLTPNAPAGGGSGNQYVFLVFGKDAATALKTRNKAVTLAVRSFQNQNVSLTRSAAERGVGLTRNVFYYSSEGPLTKSARTKVGACLR